MNPLLHYLISKSLYLNFLFITKIFNCEILRKTLRNAKYFLILISLFPLVNDLKHVSTIFNQFVFNNIFDLRKRESLPCRLRLLNLSINFDRIKLKIN